MSGNQLKDACVTLALAIGAGLDNPDFMEALQTILDTLDEKFLQRLADSPHVQDSMWGEIENHLNQHCHVEDQEQFIQAVALLEAGWKLCQ